LWLDGHPCGSGEAGDPKPRCNPANGNTSILETQSNTISRETLLYERPCNS
jgi:hypothetical protein